MAGLLAALPGPCLGCASPPNAGEGCPDISPDGVAGVLGVAPPLGRTATAGAESADGMGVSKL